MRFLSISVALTLCRNLHAEALQAAASKGFVHGPYMAASVVSKPATIREPPRPTYHTCNYHAVGQFELKRNYYYNYYYFKIAHLYSWH